MLYLGKYQDLLEALPSRSIDLVLTDPPYLFDNGRWHSSKVMGSKTILGKGSIFDTSGDLYRDMSKFGVEDIRMFLDCTLPKLRKPNMYICCSDFADSYLWNVGKGKPPTFPAVSVGEAFVYNK